MQEQQFIDLHLLAGGINSPGTINVNFNFVSDTIGEVSGITVTNIPQLDPQSTFTNLVRVLEEVTHIKFRVGTVLYSLLIEDRRAYSTPTGNAFFYFKVRPFRFTYDPNASLGQDISISLYPFLLGSKFTFSDYNPVIDNVLEQRRVPSGSRIVESDRSNVSTSPGNLNAILSGSAKLSATQESNYTATGWSNGRYRGTKTNSKNYGGVPPVLSGRTFSGAIYAPQTLDTYIASQSFSTRTIQDIFHTGRELTPTYEIISSSFETATYVDDHENVIFIQSTGSQTTTGSFDYNTLIKIDDEKMRVINYTENNSGTYLEVVRGLFGTTGTTHDGNTTLQLINPTFLYTYDNIRRQENAVSNTKVWVEETSNIYYTDAFGAIYSGSIYNT